MAYPTIGEAYTELYARINVPWGFGGDWIIVDEFVANGPAEEYPDDKYNIAFIADFLSDDYNEPFDSGQIVVINATIPVTIPVGTSFVFTKPS